MWRILIASATAIGLLGAPALAEMADWDTNADNQIDQTEFGTGFGGGDTFGEWDADDDSMLSEDEFTSNYQGDAAFSDLDADGDSSLSQDEFNQGVFASFDTDGDDMWNESEYGAFEQEGTFQTTQ